MCMHAYVYFVICHIVPFLVLALQWPTHGESLQSSLSNNLSVFLPTFNSRSALELESLQSPHTDMYLETAARVLVNRASVLSTRTTGASDEELFANEARACWLTSRHLDLGNDLTLRRDT